MPAFSLYGEQSRPGMPLLHIESIDSRSRLYDWEIDAHVHQDVEDPLHVVFVEHWADADALASHFAVPASGAFVGGLRDLTTERSQIAVFEAEPLQV